MLIWLFRQVFKNFKSCKLETKNLQPFQDIEIKRSNIFAQLPCQTVPFPQFLIIVTFR